IDAESQRLTDARQDKQIARALQTYHRTGELWQTALRQHSVRRALAAEQVLTDNTRTQPADAQWALTANTWVNAHQKQTRGDIQALDILGQKTVDPAAAKTFITKYVVSKTPEKREPPKDLVPISDAWAVKVAQSVNEKAIALRKVTALQAKNVPREVI